MRIDTSRAVMQHPCGADIYRLDANSLAKNPKSVTMHGVCPSILIHFCNYDVIFAECYSGDKEITSLKNVEEANDPLKKHELLLFIDITKSFPGSITTSHYHSRRNCFAHLKENRQIG
jgi:hypothetical protein